jgi:hypothetical protein
VSSHRTIVEYVSLTSEEIRALRRDSCAVLIGTDHDYRACSLPTSTKRDGYDVCRWHEHSVALRFPNGHG